MMTIEKGWTNFRRKGNMIIWPETEINCLQMRGAPKRGATEAPRHTTLSQNLDR
jgi:hypothetical protein